MGLEARATQLGYRVVVAYDQNLRQCVETLLDYRMDGFIWQSDAPESRGLLTMLRDTRVPVVTMHGAPVMEGISGVDCDHAMGMRSAVAYLVGLGHRRIGMAYGGIAAAFEARLTGVRSGLAASQLVLSPADVHQIELGPDGSEDAFHGGRLLGKQFAQMRDRPTAMLMGNDELAMGFIRGVHDAGQRAPRDISVVGFDDIKVASYWEVPLTTVAQPRQKLGVTAMDLLVERIDSPGAAPRHVMLPTELVIRDSCSQAPVSGQAVLERRPS
jgi:DNA-binding LacI/PurR family transcriptional regulator